MAKENVMQFLKKSMVKAEKEFFEDEQKKHTMTDSEIVYALKHFGQLVFDKDGEARSTAIACDTCGEDRIRVLTIRHIDDVSIEYGCWNCDNDEMQQQTEQKNYDAQIRGD